MLQLPMYVINTINCIIRQPGKALCFAAVYSFFITRSPRSVGRSQRNFATWSKACSFYKCRSKNPGPAPPQKKIGREKRANFGPISKPSHFER